jgi:tRNA_anti-like
MLLQYKQAVVLPKGRTMNKTVFSALAVLFALILVSTGCMGTRGSAEEGMDESELRARQMENEAASAELTAPELATAYLNSEQKADEKYKDRVLLITGVVQSVGMDAAEIPYIILTGAGAQVQTIFIDTYEEAAMDLQVGQQVTIKGRCAGRFANVMMRDAILPTAGTTGTF